MAFKISSFAKTGLVVFVTILLFIWGLNYLKGIDFFNSENKYYALYERVDGLENSADVLISGFKVGQVRSIYFEENMSGNLVVMFAIDDKFALPYNTVAKIYSSDLMGTKSIELLLTDSVDIYNSGDTIKGLLEGGLKEQVSVQMLPLKNKAEDLMVEIEKAIIIVQNVFNEKTIDNLTKSIESIKFTIKNLETTSYTIDTLVKSEKSKLANIFSNVESITSNLKQNNVALKNTIQNISSISDSIAKSNIKTAFNSAATALVQVDSIVGKINNGTGSLGLLLNNDTLYYNLEDAAYNLNRLVEDLRVNPKRYVHFSVFDIGKTVYTEEGDKATRKTDKTFYKIMLLTSNKPIALTPDNFMGIKNVEEYIDSGTYQYMVGNKKTMEKANEFLKEIKESYPEAIIVVFNKGKRIPLR
jgi:phospholipid/cholesterol/gamma-HCH transport system substrate-binding protein